jgi:hypothetical protein
MKVRLRPGDRGVLEARLRAATTEQRQLLRNDLNCRARIRNAALIT